MVDVNKAREHFEYAINSKQYKEWVRDAQKDYDFYEGRQFTEQEKQALQSRGQPVIVVNRIAVNIKNVLGQEISSRTSIAYRSRSFDPGQQELAAGLTGIAQYLQERDSLPKKLSARNKDRMICGIGWLHRELDNRGRVTYRRIDPFSMVWDVTDETDDLSDSGYVMEQKWVRVQDLIQQFPDKEGEIKRLVYLAEGNEVGQGAGVTPPVTIQDQDFNGVNTAAGLYADAKRGRIRVITYEYKENVDKFIVLTNDNRRLCTFDEDEANRIAARDEDGNQLDDATQKVNGHKIKYLIFTADIELAKGDGEIQNESFSYLPSVYERERNGVFVGLVRPAIPAQQEMNKRRSKAMHLLNSNRVLVDSDAVDSIDQLASEVSRPDGVIVKRKGSELTLLDQNQREFNSQLNMMVRAEREIDMVMGVFPEALGQETNATTGIAIQARQVGTQRNLVTALDDHKEDKKKFGLDLLSAIQNITTEETVVEVLDDDNLAQKVILNQTQKIGDKEIKKLDVRTADVDVYVIETPEYNAPPEEVAQLVSEIMRSNNGPLLLSQPAILSVLGVQGAHANRIAEAFKQATAASPDNPAAASADAGVPTA